MAITLANSTNLSGSDAFQLTAGERVQVRVQNPDLSTLLDELVPAGKVWDVTVDIDIVQNDA